MSYNNIKEYFPIFLIFIGSILFTFILHISGSFSYLEMKLYDFRFSLRGAISGSLLYDQKVKLPSPEDFIDLNDNKKWDINEEYDLGEEFVDTGSNGVYDTEEEFTDSNFNGQYDSDSIGSQDTSECVEQAGF